MFMNHQKCCHSYRISPWTSKNLLTLTARWCAFVFAFTASLTGYAEEKKATEEVDHIALATILVKDGNYNRASIVLREVNLKSPGVDRLQYFTLMGLIALNRTVYKEAVQHLEKAEFYAQMASQGKLKGTEQRLDRKPNPLLHIFLAQARFGLQDYRGAIAAIKKAGATGKKLSATYLMLSQCYWRTKNYLEAYRTLEEGLQRFPKISELARQKVLLLINMGLFQKATEESQTVLANESLKSTDYIAIGEALRRSKALGRAAELLEYARLRYPNQDEILLQLGRIYLDLKQALTAATLFRQAALLKPQMALDAAELYRRAGQPLSALYLNTFVRNQKDKIRQRLGLFIESGQFEEAAALFPRLSRLELLEDENVVYALAYAYFKTGRLKTAVSWLKRIKSSELFTKAIELRKAIEICAGHPGRCI